MKRTARTSRSTKPIGAYAPDCFVLPGVPWTFQARGPLDSIVRKYVLERDGHTCQYCDGVATEVDHVHPYSRGGTNYPSNLASCCRKCNMRALARVFDSI